MSSQRILFPEFRDEQSNSRYPFVDSATLQSATNAEIFIAKNSFIDASFFPINAVGRLYLSRIDVDPQEIKMYLGDESTEEIATAVYNAASGPENGAIEFFDAYSRPVGLLVVSSLNISLFSSWLAGSYEFPLTATEFVSTVVIPAQEPGVRNVNFADNFIYGDMWLIGDAGVVIRKEQDTEATIRIDVIGEPLFARQLCEPIADFSATSYLKTINNCGPDKFGNFVITATAKETTDPILRITAGSNSLTIGTAGRRNA